MNKKYIIKFNGSLRLSSINYFLPSIVVIDICDDNDYNHIIYRSYEFSWFGLGASLDIACDRTHAKKIIVIMPGVILKKFLKRHFHNDKSTRA